MNSIEVEVEEEEEEETLLLAKAEVKRGSKEDINKWWKVGKLSEASHVSLENGRNLDWALITIDHHFFSLPNKSYHDLHQFGECKFGGFETKVIMVSARGLVSGTLSSSWSYMMLPPGKVLVRTYLLSFSDSKSK